jgi:hypothetical protein
MELASLQIALRPRNPWEAIDLGFALARRWFWSLCSLWLMAAVPAAALGVVLFGGDLLWVSLLVWWLKPLYEPPLMFWLSRAVFSELPQRGAVRRSWWHIVRPQLFANLTWRRLGANRSFYMPVALLEGLHGRERKKRIAILGRHQQAGTWLTVVGIHFEAILELSFLFTLFFLIPEELRWFEGFDFLLAPGPIDEWLQLVCWLGSMAIIAPFYVAGGFALYLHRRSELEGWDIEIGFRNTAGKIGAERRPRAAALAAALLGLTLLVQAPQEAFAGDDPGPQQSKQIIEQVLADPLFGRMEEEGYWKYVGKQEGEAETEGLSRIVEVLLEIIKGFLRGIAAFGEAILWGAGALALAFLLYHFSRNRQWMRASGPRGGGGRKLPAELFGLDLRPESLPGDIAAEALRKAHGGELRGALSLLYRGALVRLIAEHQLAIPQSATEGECLRLVERHRGADEVAYFRQLTRAWQVTAYAHESIDAGRIEQLCHGWREVYARA